MRHSALLALPVLASVGWVFFRIGLVFFGGGFVLIPVVQHQIVNTLHWLTTREFLDGVAISQLTPGPVAVLATFCGFHMGGVAGALVATAAIFLPAFVLMLAISRGYRHLSRFQPVKVVLAAVIPAIVGLLVASAIQVGVKAITGWVDAAIALLALVLMIRWKVSPALLIAAGALLGYLLHI